MHCCLEVYTEISPFLPQVAWLWISSQLITPPRTAAQHVPPFYLVQNSNPWDSDSHIQDRSSLGRLTFLEIPVHSEVYSDWVDNSISLVCRILHGNSHSLSLSPHLPHSSFSSSFPPSSYPSPGSRGQHIRATIKGQHPPADKRRKEWPWL